MDFASANVMPVLGQVGQMAEIGERPDDADRPVTTKCLEQLFQCFIRLCIGVAPECHRQFANLLNLVKGRLPLLFPNDVAQ